MGEERVARAMPMATTTTMMTTMTMTVLGTLLTTHQGLSLIVHTALSVGMTIGATQAVRVVIAKASTITTTGTGSIFLVLLPLLHPAPRQKEERRKVASPDQRVANLAQRAERAMLMGIT